jgi:hypothetical protein
MAELKMVTVYRSQGMLGAQVLKGRLEVSGIPVYLKYESVGQVFGFTVDGLGLVEVQVPEEWAEEALEILAEPDADDEGEEENDA